MEKLEHLVFLLLFSQRQRCDVYIGDVICYRRCYASKLLLEAVVYIMMLKDERDTQRKERFPLCNKCKSCRRLHVLLHQVLILH